MSIGSKTAEDDLGDEFQNEVVPQPDRPFRRFHLGPIVSLAHGGQRSTRCLRACWAA